MIVSAVAAHVVAAMIMAVAIPICPHMVPRYVMAPAAAAAVNLNDRRPLVGDLGRDRVRGGARYRFKRRQRRDGSNSKG